MSAYVFPIKKLIVTAYPPVFDTSELTNLPNDEPKASTIVTGGAELVAQVALNTKVSSSLRGVPEVTSRNWTASRLSSVT